MKEFTDSKMDLLSTLPGLYIIFPTQLAEHFLCFCFLVVVFDI